MDRYLRELQRKGINDPSAMAAYISAVQRADYENVDLEKYIELRARSNPIYATIDTLDIYEYLAAPALRLVDFLLREAIPFSISNRHRYGGSVDERAGHIFIHLRTRIPWQPVYYGRDVLYIPISSFDFDDPEILRVSRIQVIGANHYRLSSDTQLLLDELDGETQDALHHAHETLETGISESWMSPEVAREAATEFIEENLGRDMGLAELKHHLSQHRPPNLLELYRIFEPGLHQHLILDEDSFPINTHQFDTDADYPGLYAHKIICWLQEPIKNTTNNIQNYALQIKFVSGVSVDYIYVSMAPPWNPEYLFETIILRDPYHPSSPSLIEYVQGIVTPQTLIGAAIRALDEQLEHWTLFCDHISPYYSRCEICDEEVCRACAQTGLCHA